MTNEKMALELAHLNRVPDEEDRYYCQRQCETFDAVIKTAEWKDKQFNEERKELLGFVKMLPVNETNQTIIEDLIEMLQY